MKKLNLVVTERNNTFYNFKRNTILIFYNNLDIKTLNYIKILKLILIINIIFSYLIITGTKRINTNISVIFNLFINWKRLSKKPKFKKILKLIFLYLANKFIFIHYQYILYVYCWFFDYKYIFYSFYKKTWLLDNYEIDIYYLILIIDVFPKLTILTIIIILWYLYIYYIYINKKSLLGTRL